MSAQVISDLTCYHCGQTCEEETLRLDDKSFCCYGCKTVYEILNENQLCEYYDLEKAPGIQLKEVNDETYGYLDEQEVRTQLLEFESASFSKASFQIPAIHCVSCIWLLENLQKVAPGILKAEVNFARKNLSISFNPQLIKLSKIARLLTTLGYTPSITLSKNQETKPVTSRALVLKLAIAGFCFGNVMLFSFPEYLGIDHSEKSLMRLFSWLNLALSIPVFFYSGFDYFRSAAQSFKQKQINIDVPIAAGLLALFFRSSYDIITATGPGYLDSFTGLVFFLLIGRWFQGKTYESLAFDRDFSAYFPLAVNVFKEKDWKPVIIHKLQKGDRMRIRNMEIIPADSILLDAFAYIDYSFVTGESRPVKVKENEIVYAGGRLIGSPVILTVDKKVSQSHLTSLWNNDAFKKVNESKYKKIIDKAARRFTWVVLVIAAITAVYWQIQNPESMWLVLTSVLMVACPCALALAAPFTFGSMLRVLGKNQLYLKSADVIERMANIDAVVFDKTGTITHGTIPDIKFAGELTPVEFGHIKVLTSYSTHPLSMMISRTIKHHVQENVNDFKEIPGKGLQGTILNKFYKVGSAAFVGYARKTDHDTSHVFVSIDDQVKGFFTIRTSIRSGMGDMIKRLGNKCVALLSGDNNSAVSDMKAIFGPSTKLLFNQSPHDKLKFIKDLQLQGRKVMMVGDGLNDAGALKQSEVGIAVTDDAGVFNPACDGILYGGRIAVLDKLLELSRSSAVILKVGFGISFFYNAIALSFAVTGHLTPLTAAILMPLSSVSVVGFSSLAVNHVAKKKLKELNTKQ